MRWEAPALAKIHLSSKIPLTVARSEAAGCSRDVLYLLSPGSPREAEANSRSSPNLPSLLPRQSVHSEGHKRCWPPPPTHILPLDL